MATFNEYVAQRTGRFVDELVDLTRRPSIAASLRMVPSAWRRYSPVVAVVSWWPTAVLRRMRWG